MPYCISWVREDSVGSGAKVTVAVEVGVFVPVGVAVDPDQPGLRLAVLVVAEDDGHDGLHNLSQYRNFFSFYG